MNNPWDALLGGHMGARSADIRNNLAYAYVRFLSLKEELNAAIATDEKIEFVGQKVGEIIGACRECFDYAAKDLNDAFVKAHAKNVYFPFSRDRLESKQWSGLAQANSAAHAYLLKMVDMIEKGGVYEGTLFNWGVIGQVNDLVNDKKHNRITLTKRRENSATRVVFPGGPQMKVSPLHFFDPKSMDYGQEVDATPMITNHPGVSISYISEYRLEANNWEISRFCSYAIGITWMVLNELYREAGFSVGSQEFNPAETIKSPDQVEYESFLRRAEHIVTRLLLVGFFLNDREVFLVRFEPNEVDGAGEDVKYMASLVKHAFHVHVLNWDIKPKIMELVREKWKMLESANFTPRVAKFDIGLKNKTAIKLPSGKEMIFNRCVWGVSTSFKQSEWGEYPPLFLSDEDVARVRLIFPDFQYMNAFSALPAFQ